MTPVTHADFDPVTLEILWSRLISTTAESAAALLGRSLWAADCRELYEEGLSIPPVKFLVEGRPNQDVVDFIAGNGRMPEQVLGDLQAQVSAQHVCARRLVELLDDAEMVDLT